MSSNAEEKIDNATLLLLLLFVIQKGKKGIKLQPI